MPCGNRAAVGVGHPGVLGAVKSGSVSRRHDGDPPRAPVDMLAFEGLQQTSTLRTNRPEEGGRAQYLWVHATWEATWSFCCHLSRSRSIFFFSRVKAYGRLSASVWDGGRVLALWGEWGSTQAHPSRQSNPRTHIGAKRNGPAATTLQFATRATSHTLQMDRT